MCSSQPHASIRLIHVLFLTRFTKSLLLTTGVVEEERMRFTQSSMKKDNKDTINTLNCCSKQVEEMAVREKRRPTSPLSASRIRNPSATTQKKVLRNRLANAAKGRQVGKKVTPRSPVLRPVDPREGLSPKEVIEERMKSWGPSLPFPFDFNDITDYDPIGAQKVLNAEQERSERAHQKYLMTVEKGKRQVEERRYVNSH